MSHQADDLDDDLRSLLSGKSSGKAAKTGKNKSGGGNSGMGGAISSGESISLGSLLSGDQHQHQHQHHSSFHRANHPSQRSQHNHITHLSSSGCGGSATGAAGGVVSGAASIASNASSNSMSGRTNGNSNVNRSRRALYILGSIILGWGLVGPSGVLWDLFEDDDGGRDSSGNNLFVNPAAPSSNSYERGAAAVSGPPPPLGDKHHALTPRQFENQSPYSIENPPPMIRSVIHPIPNTAAGSSKHERFGSKNKFSRKKHARGIHNKKKRHNSRNHGDDDSPIHSSIRDAIDNIDKVYMDPHVASAVASPMKKFRKQNNNDPDAEWDDDAFPINIDDDTLVPLIHANDDALPINAETMTYQMPASDALECRASVVAFVINATDVRDECDGLRKAFDKTCSVSGTAAAAAAAVSGAGTNVGDGGGEGMATQGRRRLQEWGKPRLSKLHPWLGFDVGSLNLYGGQTISEKFHETKQYWSNLLTSVGSDEDDDTILFVEDQVADAKYWEAAKNMVQSGKNLSAVADKVMEKKTLDLFSHRRLENAKENNVVLASKPARKAEASNNSAQAAATTVPPAQQKPQKEQAQPMISLIIPTSEEHINDQVLNDALMLQESKKKSTSGDNNDVISSSTGGNQTNSEQPPEEESGNKKAAAEAARDASESAEAIRTATEAVKNIMNDPKSIEARTCCASILSVFHEHCDPTTTGVDDYSDRRLLVIVFVITVCGMVKSIIRFFNIRWLPEAGGCILVGVMGYLILQNMPHVQFAFDGDMFLRIMVPPIVFEAAVKINKRSFHRHIIPITIYAIVGTLVSTTFTAFILHKGSMSFNWCTTIPLRESLIFGSLISSIDPIAVLSVLNNMGMTDSDTIYVLIFGESLLNDGVAIVLFQTLVHFLDESLEVDRDAIFDATMHFVVVAVGSLAVGVLSGACATVYFNLMHGCQTPMVEVIMFFCWAFIPYYICDMVEWSGIVAIVANGFVMDLYVVGQRHQQTTSTVEDEIDFLVNGNVNGNYEASRSRKPKQRCRSFFTYEGHLSDKANGHVHFILEIFATLMETAIFAYLGLFLFSPRYHWNKYLTLMSILATVMGRFIMIPCLSHIANIINRMSLSRNRSSCLPRTGAENPDGVHVDRRMQLVLIFAGLRGAMSFALVEHIPLYDTTTGQGTRLKPELKAMTSASIVFTVFVLGGATSYLMERLGYSINPNKEHSAVEIAPLMQNKQSTPNATSKRSSGFVSALRDGNNNDRHRGNGQPSNNSMRQRGTRS
mmetsp:Transcript_16709/g.34898  ORF Transcript_16709/g.34898 Transcript_16709/m.34898 type:complete len:1258 (+) Transcript_16709:259-4032(+)